jgi:hypothetical protein
MVIRNQEAERCVLHNLPKEIVALIWNMVYDSRNENAWE